MKTMFICIAVLGCMLSAGSQAQAAGLAEIVADGCKEEINAYCKDVTPGEGRVLACLFAREDKLSMRCQYALFDASAQLQQAVAAITYLANECRDDLKTLCSGVKAGEGRLLECIDRNMDKVSARCKQAIKDVSRK